MTKTIVVFAAPVSVRRTKEVVGRTDGADNIASQQLVSFNDVNI